MKEIMLELHFTPQGFILMLKLQAYRRHLGHADDLHKPLLSRARVLIKRYGNHK